MIELWIDDQMCDIEKLPAIPINYDIVRLADVEGARSGRTIELELPVTSRNEAMFAPSRDIYATSRFNNQHHRAVVKRNGVVVFEGTAYLRSTTINKECSGCYKIKICEGGAEWVESVVHGRLSDLDIPFSAYYNLSYIEDSWKSDRAVHFLPVWRGGKRYAYSSSALPPERVMLTDDYYPFISVAAMVKAMFAGLGYTLHSSLLDSEMGQSLCMSGDYSRSDAFEAKAKCDFLARRSSPITATADYMGRVYTTTSMATHTIGPIVDTADPLAVDSDGVQMVETFNTLNVFSKNRFGNICFTPSKSVKAGFMLHLEYTTEYKILSRERLMGFDIVEGVNGLRVDFPLVNTYQDFRNKLSSNWQYRAMVFNHISGREYKLMATPAAGSSYSMGQWSSRSALVTTSALKPTKVELYYRDNSSAGWAIYQDDWALYEGFIEEEGEVNVAMDIRMAPTDIAAGEVYELDKIWFGGAEQGMKITVGNGTTLRPYFSAIPGYGSLLQFEDIAPRHIRQSELLAALGEMFNLVFFTDRERKAVYIEPLEAFYKEESVIDIANAIDYRRGIAVSDSGLDTPQRYLFAYRDEDAASHKFNNENETVVGEWSYYNPLRGTIDSERRVGNQLFTTTINRVDIVDNAPSASVIQVGDIGASEEGSDQAFTPHIVCYKGMHILPEGECWIANQKRNEYPYAAFVDNVNVNLGFETRNGIEGLHSYHLPALLRQTEGHRVTLDLCLTLAETASLLTDNGPKPSVRTLYRFEIQGESSLYRMVEIGSWDTENGVVQCTFERVLKD